MTDPNGPDKSDIIAFFSSIPGVVAIGVIVVLAAVGVVVTIAAS